MSAAGIEASTAVRAKAAAARVMERCAALAAITEHPGEILRTFLSPAMDDVHRTMRPWIEAAGMASTVDTAGNLRALYKGGAPRNRPRVLIGSHLDTVPNAGAFDGVVGVLIGLALVEACAETRLPFDIEVMGFSDEEGTRFGVPFLGSRALVGELDPRLLACVDRDGISVSDAMAHYAALHPQVIEAKLSPDSAAYLEFHIEQGPVLEDCGLALGIVDGLAGQSRCNLVFRGRAGHAGTTPMRLRSDALAAAAEWIAETEAIASRSDGLVATVGQIAVDPGAVNVIPGEVRCSLDVRHANDAARNEALQSIFAFAREAAARRRVHVETAEYHTHAAVRLDTTMVAMAERAATQAGYATMRMTSGAGHDAMILAFHVPSAMIFLRNPGGISHHPEESVAEDDVAAAIHAGLCWIDEIGAWLRQKESGTSASSNA